MAHKAQTALDGKTINGYTVRIKATSPREVQGVLVDTSGKKRSDLPFLIRAKEEQFGVQAVLADIGKELLDYIKREASGPTQGNSFLRLLYGTK
jgi:hypothetical protein